MTDEILFVSNRGRGCFRSMADARNSDYKLVMRKPIENILAPDKRQRVTFYRRSDDCYEFSIDKFHVDDLPEYNHHMEYWAPFHFSGVYDSLATAKRETAAEFPWVIDAHTT